MFSSLKQAGYDPDPDKLIAMRIHGATPDGWSNEEAGYEHLILTTDLPFGSWKAPDFTPASEAGLRSSGGGSTDRHAHSWSGRPTHHRAAIAWILKNLSVDQLVSLRFMALIDLLVRRKHEREFKKGADKILQSASLRRADGQKTKHGGFRAARSLRLGRRRWAFLRRRQSGQAGLQLSSSCCLLLICCSWHPASLFLRCSSHTQNWNRMSLIQRYHAAEDRDHFGAS